MNPTICASGALFCATVAADQWFLERNAKQAGMATLGALTWSALFVDELFARHRERSFIRGALRR